MISGATKLYQQGRNELPRNDSAETKQETIERAEEDEETSRLMPAEEDERDPVQGRLITPLTFQTPKKP